MTRIALLIATVTLSFSSFSFDWCYNHLDKLYYKDRQKCLDRSQLIMEHFPETASSYFFATRVYLKYQENPRTVLAGFNQLNLAMKYARKFNSLADTDAKSTVNWEEYLNQIDKSVINLSGELKEAGYVKQSDILLTQLAKTIPQQHEIDLFEDVASNENLDEVENLESLNSNSELTTNSKPEEVDFTNATKMMMNGLPSGNEDIPTYNYKYERNVLDLINIERLRLGLDTLEWDWDLARACRYHAFDQGVQDYFDHNTHDIKNGRLVETIGTFERIRLFYDKSFVNTENIAAGNEKPKDTYQQWYTSKGHYDNMFNKSSKKAAVGVVYVPGSQYGYYWVFCSAL